MENPKRWFYKNWGKEQPPKTNKIKQSKLFWALRWVVIFSFIPLWFCFKKLVISQKIFYFISENLGLLGDPSVTLPLYYSILYFLIVFFLSFNSEFSLLRSTYLFLGFLCFSFFVSYVPLLFIFVPWQFWPIGIPTSWIFYLWLYLSLLVFMQDIDEVSWTDPTKAYNQLLCLFHLLLLLVFVSFNLHPALVVELYTGFYANFQVPEWLYFSLLDFRHIFAALLYVLLVVIRAIINKVFKK